MTRSCSLTATTGSQVGRDRVDRDAELEMTSRGFLFLDDQGTPGDGLIGEEPVRSREPAEAPYWMSA